MSENLCVVCGRPTPDGYACPAEAAEAAQKLSAIVDLAPEARQVAYGLTRRSQEGGSGRPGSRSPGNDDAMDALGEVQNTLTTWARHVAEERGGDLYPVGQTDPIVIAAEALRVQVEWLRHRPEVDEVFADISECLSKLRFTTDGPRAKKYLGPCGAVRNHGPACVEGLDMEHGPDCDCCACYPDPSEDVCEGDVYGPAGGRTGRCRTCGAEVDQGERRAWLDEQVVAHTADTPLRARDIAHAIRINVNTIRTWAHTVYDDKGEVQRAAKLSTYWWDGQRFVPWVPPREGEDVKARGPRLYYVADVQKLAREAAARRTENEAKRARRDSVEMGA